jgi:TRAP-type C4-dicarboxylate transport system permease small subunit
VKPLRLGVLLAVVVAGPPLWIMVRSDQLDSDAALQRWAAVAAICSLALSGLAALIRAYEQQAAKQRRERLIEEAERAIDATASGDRAA